MDDDKTYGKLITQNRQGFVNICDANTAFLIRLMDRLVRSQCLPNDQKVLVDRETNTADRCRKLLELISAQGQCAFRELCVSLMELNTTESRRLAEAMMRDSLKYEHYKQWKDGDANVIHTLSENNRPIWGIATLNGELFIAAREWNGDEYELAVYDTMKFNRLRSASLSDPCFVIGMTGCSLYQCIFIADLGDDFIYRVSTELAVSSRWPVGDKPYGLSATSNGNLLVACPDVAKFKEFTHDGNLIREVRVDADVVEPWHAVELKPNEFVVCHGEHHDSLNRVCIVNDVGAVLRSYGTQPGPAKGQLNGPVSVDVSGFVFVADHNNGRVVMLTTDLDFVCVLTSGASGPWRVCYEDKTARLFVADNKWENGILVNGNVKVFEC